MMKQVAHPQIPWHPAVNKPCFCATENSAWAWGGGNPAIWFPVLHNLGQVGSLRELDCSGSRKEREERSGMQGELHWFSWAITLCSSSFPVLLVLHSGWSLASCWVHGLPGCEWLQRTTILRNVIPSFSWGLWILSQSPLGFSREPHVERKKTTMI